MKKRKWWIVVTNIDAETGEIINKPHPNVWEKRKKSKNWENGKIYITIIWRKRTIIQSRLFEE